MDHIWVTPIPKIGLWTFAPAFSPRFYFPLSPRSIFQTAQRFLLQNHVTSGLGDVTSGSGPVTSGSGHVTSGSGHVTSP